MSYPTLAWKLARWLFLLPYSYWVEQLLLSVVGMLSNA